MKKQLIIIGLTALLSCIALSGCDEQSGETQQDTTKLELVNYNITTEPYLGGEVKIITANVRNIAGHMLDMMYIKIKFYDINRNLLNTKETHITNLANTNTTEINVRYYSSEEYYDDVDWDNIKFEFLTYEEDNDKMENEKTSLEYTLTGSWQTYPYYYKNGVRIDDTPSTATIYENGTMASISVFDGSTIWTPYSMVNEQFCLGEEPYVYCYDIEFFDNGSRAILSTYYEDPETGLMNQLFIELIRTL